MKSDKKPASILSMAENHTFWTLLLQKLCFIHFFFFVQTFKKKKHTQKNKTASTETSLICGASEHLGAVEQWPFGGLGDPLTPLSKPSLTGGTLTDWLFSLSNSAHKEQSRGINGVFVVLSQGSGKPSKTA